MNSVTSHVARSFLLLLMLYYGRGHSSCIQNFLSATDIETIALETPQQLEIRHREQHIFPTLTFSCYGTIISWRVAAPTIDNGGARPEISVWRQVEGNPQQYTKISGQQMQRIVIEQLDGTGIVIIENTATTPLLFEPGDILGLNHRRESVADFVPYLYRVVTSEGPLNYFTPESNIVSSFTQNPTNSDDLLPLVSIEITCTGVTSPDNNTECESSSDQTSVLPSPNPLAVSLSSPTDSPPTSSSTITAPTPYVLHPNTTVPVAQLPTSTPPTSSQPLSTALPSSTLPPSSSSSDEAVATELLIVIIVLPAGIIVVALIVAIIITLLCCMSGKEPDKHQTSYTNNEIPMVDIIPTTEEPHMYENPTGDGYIVSIHNDLYDTSNHHSLADRGAGFDYEEPVPSLSQFGAAPEFMLGGQDKHSYSVVGNHRHIPVGQIPFTPTLPVPGSTFNFNGTYSHAGGQTSPHGGISPVHHGDRLSPHTAAHKFGTFSGRLSPHPPPHGSPAFYHTLEMPGKAPALPARPRLQSNDSAKMGLGGSKSRSKSTDELSPQTRTRLRSFDNSIVGVGASQVSPDHNMGTLTMESLMMSGIYVPTQEQRSTGEQLFDDSIYTCLGEDPMDPHSPLSHTLNFFEESEFYWRPASDTAGLYDQLACKRYREILRKKIIIKRHLGSGEFGTVCQGTWHTSKGTVDVAVKMLNSKADETTRVRFLQEAAIMGQFRHPNIVRLHGVVTVGNPVMIVLELMKNGDLRNHVKSLRPVPGELPSIHLPQKLLDYCSQIALGMEYLARKEFVHRDIAARNILLTEENVCKIADFGMSRVLDDDDYYISHGGKIPIKWTAPEAISYRKYSTASDVWSFGCLMFEIWSLGHSPFKQQSPEEAIQLVEDGYRLLPPPGCPRALYELMTDCWHPDPHSRPTFTKVVQTLSKTDATLLEWSETDMKVHPQAAMLGGLLEAGEKLYLDLQEKHIITQK